MPDSKSKTSLADQSFPLSPQLSGGQDQGGDVDIDELAKGKPMEKIRRKE